MSRPAGVLGYARKWHADGEVPAKVKNENGRMAWPTKFKFLAVTPNRVFPTDVALVDRAAVTELLTAALGARDALRKVAEGKVAPTNVRRQLDRLHAAMEKFGEPA